MILQIQNIDPQRIAAIDSNGDKLTYADITLLSQQISTNIQERALCFLLVENNVGGIAWTMSMLESQQLVPLILNVKTEDSLYKQLVDTYQPTYICAPSYVTLQGEVIDSQFGYQLYKISNNHCFLHPELSHLLPTSGSTGSPKLVRHQYENIEAAGLNISTFFELKPTDRPLMVLPLYYTMGLSMVFSHLRVGATVLITGLSMTDSNFWKFLKEQHATSFTGVPYSFQVLNLMRFFRMDLPDMELLTQGGGKMPTDLNRKFAEYCRDNGKRWIATYGQSECTARMAYLPAKWAVDKVGSIGIAVPNGELSLIDTEGKTITTSNTEGEMCYRGKNVTMGYAREQADLALGDERNGYIRTGDLAYFDEDGCYYIVGRMGRFLKLFGMRVGLDECEQIVHTECGIECACVGTDEKMIVYITHADKQSEVKDVLVQKTHIVATSFEIRIIPEIPKNEAGKKLYSKLDNQ
ncbi:MAG: AMP-binding protein [Paludibacteraceae bacterium]|nr:AMP-binding protein [Paludibacteraceae bacterium]